MKTTSVTTYKLPIGQLLLACLSALVLIGIITNLPAQFGISDHTALLALTVIGFALCGLGPLGKMSVYGWANPRHLLGYAIGAATLLAAAAGLFNFPFLWITSERLALLTVAAAMLVKIAIAATYPRPVKA